MNRVEEQGALRPRDAVATAGLVLLFMLPMAMGLVPVMRQGQLWSLAGGVAVQTAATFGAVFVILRRRRIRWALLGWSGKLRLVVAGITAGCALFLAVQAAGLVLSRMAGPLPVSRTLLDAVLSQRSLKGLLLFLAVAGVLAPIGEELFFRGILYSALRNRYGRAAAAMASAVAFALLHGEWTAMAVPIWLAGVVLAVAYQATGSLVTPIVAHCVHNVLTAVVAYLVV